MPVFGESGEETLTQKERDSVLYFVVPGFDLSRPTLGVFNLKSEFLPPLHHTVPPACLPSSSPALSGCLLRASKAFQT